jgi:hypothetical protein
LRVHASHGFAVEKLIQTLALSGTRVERKYVGSIEAVASLHEGACEIAGFHIPQGEFEELPSNTMQDGWFPKKAASSMWPRGAKVSWWPAATPTKFTRRKTSPAKAFALSIASPAVAHGFCWNAF